MCALLGFPALPVQADDNVLPLQTDDRELPLQADENELPLQADENELPLQADENVLPLQTDEKALPDQSDGKVLPNQKSLMNNAALYYWKAMASMQVPRTSQDIASTAFIQQELYRFPPSVFSIRKDVAVWLISENALIASLRQGRMEKDCAFPIHQANSPSLNLTHLTPMREMTRYCLEISKAYEYAENYAGAAGVYILLQDMISKLHQDNNMTSAQAGWSMLQDVAQGLEGYATRKQSPEALESILRYFDANPELQFRISEYLLGESQRYSEWLIEDPTKIIRRLSSLYGRKPDQPGVLKLASLSMDDQVLKLEDWIQGYQNHMAELAKWVDKPYLVGLPQLELLDDNLEKEINKDGGDVENPLLPLLVPYMRRVYERSLLAKGQYRMMRTVLEAARYESLVGQWPKNLDTLEEFSGRTTPLDPFTGNKLFFRIRNKAPYISLRAPKWMAQEDTMVYRLMLAIRKTRDQNNFHRLQQSTVKKFIEKQKNQPLITPDTKR
jgi:hypothetical protein